MSAPPNPVWWMVGDNSNHRLQIRIIYVTNTVTYVIFACNMRVIAVKTLTDYIADYHQAEQVLLSWHEEASLALWNNPNELKRQYRNASVISSKRVVFNIHGNSYRLIVDIEYRLKIVFVVWFGTHKEYDLIDAKQVSYVKTH